MNSADIDDLRAELAAATAEIERWKTAEHNLSNAYLRLRGLLEAFDTPAGITAEQMWEHTEGKAKDLLAQLTEAYEAGKREQAAELAAEQAKNVGLLEIAKKGLWQYENRNAEHGTRNPAAIALDEIAAAPSDTSALDKIKAEYEAQIEMMREALEAAYNGLRWWMDAFPLHVTEADNEEMLKLVKALSTAPDQALEQFVATEPK